MRKALAFIFVMIIFIQSCAPDGWSPEDAGILFSSNRSGNLEIYTKHADDTTWINLSRNDAGDNWPVWSPDGNKIVFQSTRSGKLDIWIMNKDGSDQKQLTRRADQDYLPSFTPDGTRITFTSWRTESKDEDRAPRIYIMNSDGSNQTRLVEKSPNTSTGVSWHPSGTRFLFTEKTDDGAGEIVEADNNGNFLNQLTNDNLYSGSAEYSPDGLKIVFYQDDETISKIIVMNSNGSGRSTIVDDGKNYYPHWSQDGKWITYSKTVPGTDDKDIDIYAVSLEGTSPPVKIIGSGSRDSEGRWHPLK
jgi:Tol biopolymer transport system component